MICIPHKAWLVYHRNNNKIREVESDIKLKKLWRYKIQCLFVFKFVLIPLITTYFNLIHQITKVLKLKLNIK